MIPDDEPWWKVRCNTDNGLAAERQQAINAEPASETLQVLDALDFRPIGYEW